MYEQIQQLQRNVCDSQAVPLKQREHAERSHRGQPADDGAVMEGEESGREEREEDGLLVDCRKQYRHSLGYKHFDIHSRE